MNQYLITRIDQLEVQLRQVGILMAQQQQQIEALKQENQKQRKWLEKLVAKDNLEWSQDADDWREKAALDELRNPKPKLSSAKP